VRICEQTTRSRRIDLFSINNDRIHLGNVKMIFLKHPKRTAKNTSCRITGINGLKGESELIKADEKTAGEILASIDEVGKGLLGTGY